MIVKVCGLREPDNIRAVAALPVDWLGLVFHPPSPRHVGQDFAGRATDLLGRSAVAVVVDWPVEAILERLTAFPVPISAVQLHGHESPADCARLRRTGRAVIKAFSIAGDEDLLPTRDYEGRADYFLFDTKCAERGGSGRSFDWSVLRAYRGATPFLLSGGLNPDSLAALRTFRHPRWAGIDLNSGFELAPGMKNVAKLREFIAALAAL